MNLLFDRYSGTHYYSIEIPDWVWYKYQEKVVEIGEYYRGRKYKCYLSEKEYSDHNTFDDNRWLEMIKYYKSCVGE